MGTRKAAQAGAGAVSSVSPSPILPSMQPQFVPGCYWECLTARAWDLLGLDWIETILECAVFCFLFYQVRIWHFWFLLFLNFHSGEFLVSFISEILPWGALLLPLQLSGHKIQFSAARILPGAGLPLPSLHFPEQERHQELLFSHLAKET